MDDTYAECCTLEVSNEVPPKPERSCEPAQMYMELSANPSVHGAQLRSTHMNTSVTETSREEFKAVMEYYAPPDMDTDFARAQDGSTKDSNLSSEEESNSSE